MKLRHKANIICSYGTGLVCYELGAFNKEKALIMYQKGSAKSFLKNHQDLRHDGEPENFKCVVLQKFKDPLTRQVAESLNIADNMNVVELCNSKAEYHQPQIVRVSRQVQRGL